MIDYLGIAHLPVVVASTHSMQMRRHALAIIGNYRNEMKHILRALQQLENSLQKMESSPGGTPHDTAVGLLNARNWSLSLAQTHSWLQASLLGEATKFVTSQKQINVMVSDLDVVSQLTGLFGKAASFGAKRGMTDSKMIG
jgi:hypothetical protein